MKQKLILITGSPCVGKTTVAERLFETCEDSAYFDGDWAWCVNPFSLSDPRLRNGDKTMSFALSNYLRSGFAYVIFSSVVIIGAEIREAILRDIDADRVYDGRLYIDMLGGDACRAAPPGAATGPRSRTNGCGCRPAPGDRVLDTDGKTPAQLAAEIKRIADAAE